MVGIRVTFPFGFRPTFRCELLVLGSVTYFWFIFLQASFLSKVVSTHRTGTHPEQPLPTGYKGIPFIVGEWGIAERVCDIGVCCNFLGPVVGGGTLDSIPMIFPIIWGS